MPSAIAHYLLAQEALPRCAQPLDREAFLCGAQGPDFLFLHRCLPWQHGQSLYAVGKELHRRSPSAFFEGMRRWLIEHPEGEAARAYVLGFLTHYAFDRTAHPYVYSQALLWTESMPQMSRREAHARIETALDVILLRYLRGQTPLELPMKRVYPKPNGKEGEIAAMLSFALHRFPGENIAPEKLLQAMRDFRLCQRLLNDSTLLKKPFMERLERLNKKRKVSPSAYIHPMSEGDEDFANILHDRWQSPFEKDPQTRTEDFFELYHAALKLSGELMNGFLDSLTRPEVDIRLLTQEISYETGLPVRDDGNFDTLL